MATAFIRVKVDLPDRQAAKLVAHSGAIYPPSGPSAKQIVAAVTESVIHDLQGSPLVRSYGAAITHHPR